MNVIIVYIIFLMYILCKKKTIFCLFCPAQWRTHLSVFQKNCGPKQGGENLYCDTDKKRAKVGKTIGLLRKKRRVRHGEA